MTLSVAQHNCILSHVFLFFFNNTLTTEIYTLSLHDALPIWANDRQRRKARRRHDNFVFVHPKAAMSGDYVGCSVVHKDYHVCSSILARQRQGKRGGGCRRTPLARRRHCSVQANNDANESVRSQ